MRCADMKPRVVHYWVEPGSGEFFSERWREPARREYMMLYQREYRLKQKAKAQNGR